MLRTTGLRGSVHVFMAVKFLSEGLVGERPLSNVRYRRNNDFAAAPNTAVGQVLR
jgi:hypothetical protein